MGYGGTKSEMERLIADANEYAKANGKAADLSVDSFSDIVTAIDLIQQKQGIAGTTAKEAATTIEGALKMTKAAWENLVAGLANPDADMGQLMDNLVTAIVGDKEGEGLLNQIIPAIQNAVQGIGKLLQKAIPMLAKQLPTLIQTFLPVVVDALVSLVSSIAQALPSIIVTLVEMAPQLIEKVVNGIVQAITQAVPILVSNAPKIVKALVTGIVQSVGTLLSAAKEMLASLAEAVNTGLETAANNAISYAQQIPQKIASGLGSLWSAGAALIEGLWGGIKATFDSVIARVRALASALPEAVKKVLGIASPSKVFMELGKWIPEGLAEGIERNIGVVYDASDVMSDATLFSPETGGAGAGAGAGLGTQIINYISIYDASDAEQVADAITKRLSLQMRSA